MSFNKDWNVAGALVRPRGTRTSPGVCGTPSSQRHLLHIIWVHQHLVVPESHVELGEELDTAQLVQELLHNGDGELVLDRGVVERAVVDAEPLRAVMLADEERR